MQSLPKWARFGAAAVIIAFLAQCSSKKTNSSLVEVTVIPDQPIVITGDGKDMNGNVIKAPWFQFRLHVKNGSKKPVTLVSVTWTSTETDATGKAVSKDESSSATDYDFSTDNYQCSYSSFGTFEPGDDKGISLEGSNLTVCQGYVPLFTSGGHAKNTNNTYNIRVQLEPQGWFGTFDDPTDRFDKDVTFYTQ